MAETTTTTEREKTAGGKGAGAFVKRNKVLVGVAGGGALLYFIHKNSASTTGASGTDPVNVTALAPAAPIDESPQDPVTLDPGQSIYNPNTGQTSTAPPDPVDNPPPPADVNPPADATPTETAPAPSPTPPTGGQTGITIAGHHFAGATHSSVVGSATDARGHYVIHLVQFTNRSERWYHYTSGQWTGPHAASNATNGSKTASKPPVKTAPHPTPATAAPHAGTTASGPGMTGHPAMPSPKTRTQHGKHEWYWDHGWHTVPPPPGKDTHYP